MAKVKRGFTFDQMEIKKPNYSKFNLSHDHLCAMGSGYLVPLWWTECVPGDYWNMNISAFARLLALSSPMLQREDITIRAFKVPLRILCDRKDLDLAYTGGKDGEHPLFPFMTWDYDDLDVGSLADYLQLPLPYVYNNATGWKKISPALLRQLPSTSIFPALAYHRIYHDHFRNEETENQWLDVFEQHFSELDGANSSDSLDNWDSDAQGDIKLSTLHKVCWERDYFTSALSSPQRGSEVHIPLVGSATASVDLTNRYGGDNNIVMVKDAISGQVGSADTSAATQVSGQTINMQTFDSNGVSVVVNGSEFTGIGAIALRMMMNLQAFLERNNISGYRMIGNILAHFGVTSSNRLLDEAEYLGGIKAPITISAVNQTSATQDGSTPQGTQVGTGQSAFSGHLCRTFCEEPSILMVVGYITGKSSYSQGLARKWTRRSHLDYYWPEFQSVGEQEILNQELYFDYRDENNVNTKVWAYQSRFSEYKYEPDSIAGDFRTSLSYWHQSRLFNNLPSFNDNFVKSNLSDRVFALDSETYPRPYLCEFYFDTQVVRPMDKYAQSKLW